MLPCGVRNNQFNCYVKYDFNAIFTGKKTAKKQQLTKFFKDTFKDLIAYLKNNYTNYYYYY